MKLSGSENMMKKCPLKEVRIGESVWHTMDTDKYKSSDTEETCELRTQGFSDILLYESTPEEIEKGNYKYLIEGKIDGGFYYPVTAFHTDEGLREYKKDAGLKEGEEIKHLSRTKSLMGCYERVSAAGNKRGLNKFGKENNLKSTRVLSNGRYTRGYIDRSEKCTKIYYLNPNYDREDLPYEHK